MRISTIIMFLTFMGAATAYPQTKLPTFFAKPIPSNQLVKYEEMLVGGCSLGCAIDWTFETTSTLKPSNGNTYAASNLGDTKLATAWVEGAVGYGVGEKIIIKMDVHGKQHDIPFRGMDVVTGFAKSEKAWSEHSRVKSLRVYHNDIPVFIIILQDTRIPQTVSFPSLLINTSDTVMLEIMEIYPGKHKDTAISEINLYGAH